MPYTAAAVPAWEGSLATCARALLLALSMTACAGGPAPAPPAAVPTVVPAPGPSAAPAAGPATPQPLPQGIFWVRNAAEYRALALQTFRMAGDRLRELAAGRAPGSWAVILDADETVVDNSEFQQRMAVAGTRIGSAQLQSWWRERGAGAVPGARVFLDMVASLGGRIAIVSNRDEPWCADTRANLEALGLRHDAVLCRIQSVSDKNPRFDAVTRGTTGQGLPPLQVLMWVGDNIEDFPRLNQEVRHQGDQAFEAFGRSFIVIPNPMYGSWTSNTPR